MTGLTSANLAIGTVSYSAPEQLMGGEIDGRADQYALEGEGADVLTPVDFGDVCVNVDDAWFAAKKMDPPKTLDDLTDRTRASPRSSTGSPAVSPACPRSSSSWR